MNSHLFNQFENNILDLSTEQRPLSVHVPFEMEMAWALDI